MPSFDSRKIASEYSLFAAGQAYLMAICIHMNIAESA
jgi:hypothetical protein